MRCLAHDRGFTLYPCGHVPYGRKAVAPVGPEGSRIAGADWLQTIFAAAVDAAAGRRWQKEWEGIPLRSWRSTMARHLDLAAAWLGIAPEVTTRDRERRAADLGIDLLALEEAAKEIAGSSEDRIRGRAVVRILDGVAALPDLLVRLLRAGHAAGLVGEALLYAGKGRPLRSVLRERGEGRGSPRSRDPPRIGSSPRRPGSG